VRIKRIAVLGVSILLVSCGGKDGGSGGTTASPVTCAGIATLGLSGITVSHTEVVASANGVPQHCLVQGAINTTIQFELRLPDNWNGRFLMQGAGGFAGVVGPAYGIYRAGSMAALTQGWAVASTDSGHQGRIVPELYNTPAFDAQWALNNPSAEEDWAYRGIQRTTSTAKQIINRYYARSPAHSYFAGCSGGGWQGLKAAQHNSEDFDGFVVGAPMWSWTEGVTRINYYVRVFSVVPLPYDKTVLLESKVRERCDAQDGAADGLVSDPKKCDFNPSTLLCPGADAPTCLTQDQVNAVTVVYDGVRNSSNQRIAFGMTPSGGEAGGNRADGWPWWFAGGVPLSGNTPPVLPAIATFGGVVHDQFLRYLAFDPDEQNFNWATFNNDVDPGRMTRAKNLIDVTRTDFSDFRARGKKVLMFSGWADGIISSSSLVDYYEHVAGASGGMSNARDFFRLFMIPGMQHCDGGNAFDQFEALDALVDWVENGVTPQTLHATSVAPGFFPGKSRDHCPYPQVSRYTGSGGFDDRASFLCVDPI